MALTPAQLAKSGTEDGTQAAIIQACAQYIYPAFPLAELLYHVPNGGSRGASRQDAQIAGAQMMRLGTKAGTPDLCLPVPRQGYGALYIEVKSPDGRGKLSPQQVDRIKRLTLAGNFCGIVDDWKDGYNLIRNYIFDLTIGNFQAQYAYRSISLNDGDATPLYVYDPKGYVVKYNAAPTKRKR